MTTLVLLLHSNAQAAKLAPRGGRTNPKGTAGQDLRAGLCIQAAHVTLHDRLFPPQATKQAPQGEHNTQKEAAAAMGHEHGGGLHLRERIKSLFGSSSKKEE